MPKTRAEKKVIIQNLIEKIQRMKSLVFLDFTGLTTAETDALRAKCQPQSEYWVVKKTLVDVAIKEAQQKGISLEGFATKDLEGEIALVFGYEDELHPMKVTQEFAKEHKALKLRGGVYNFRFLDVSGVSAMALIPRKQESLARLIGSLRAPVAGLVSVLGGNLRGLLQVLQARSAKISSSG
jgi:large subunit ribosomal protein L10